MSVKLEGELLRFSYQTEQNSFAVARIRNSEMEFIAVGSLGHVIPGQQVMMVGTWKSHPSFGRQFQVERVLVDDPKTMQGLILYLSSAKVKGLGKTMATRIVDAFGLQTLEILNQDPQKLLTVNGIGKKRANGIIEQWQRERQHKELMASLRGLGFGPLITQRIVETYADDALQLIAQNPYRLTRDIRGIGFKSADQLALQQGIAEDSPLRAQAAVIHVLQEAETNGHCYLSTTKLVDAVKKYNVPVDAITEAMTDMLSDRRLYQHPHLEDRIYRPQVGYIEQRISNLLKNILDNKQQRQQLLLYKDAPVDIAKLQTKLGIIVNERQKQAVLMAMSNNVSIITGGPGTGKTTIVQFLLAAANARGEKWLLAAPTGRAAKRMTEATNVEAQTIHRLLSFNGHSKKFSHDHTNPIAADGILIDEASMIDLWLMDSLLRALKTNTRFVLVGDVDQLPSVGPGRIFGDMIDSGKLPVVRLTEVYRQAQNSNIVKNAHRVNHGFGPQSSEYDETPAAVKDFFVIPRETHEEVQQAIVEIVANRLPNRGFVPATEIQILTPMHNGPLGTAQLNAVLQNILNPDQKSYVTKNKQFRIGDRVLQVRNDYENNIYNGDIGWIHDIESDGVLVRFEDNIVSLSGAQLNDLELAYAISIHKSQGSEYKAVVIVLHKSHRIMLRKNLLYTAITRAKQFCCVVGSPWAMQYAASNKDSLERWTSLVENLQQN